MASGLDSGRNSSSVELCCLEVLVQFVSALSPSSVVASPPQTCRLTLTILLRGPASSPQAVEVRITDPSEPLLLLSSVVAAGDYPALRQNQGLLVEFSSFPQRLVELLRLCQQEQDSPHPKFVLVLSGAGQGLLTGTIGGGSAGLLATLANSVSGGLVLEVVESNPFKRLSHLSLSVCSASTHDKLCYLASCIDNLKSSSSTKHKHLQSSFSAVQEELLQCRQQLQQCKEESTRQQQQSRDASVQLQQQHLQQLQEEREKLLKERSDGDRRVSRVRSELEARAATQQRRLEALTADNRAAAEHRAHAEAALREVRDRLSSTESSCSQLRAEQAQLQAGLAQAQEQLHGTRSRGADLERRLDESEHDRAALRRSLQHTSHALDQAKEKQSELETALSVSAAKCSKREASAAAVFMELQKSLQVIRSLQQRQQVLQQQKEEREAALVKQEKKLELAEGRATSLEGRMKETEQLLRGARQQVGELEKQKRHLQDQLTESRERADAHEKAVTWLQQRLDKAGAAAALVERVPLAGAYLRTQTAGSKTTSSISTTAIKGNGSVDSVASRAVGYGTGSGGNNGLATSTPLFAPSPPDRAAPLRQAAFNSLSAVRTPGGGGGDGALPPLHEDDEDKENSGLGPEYLTATTKNKTNSSGGLTVRGLIPSKGGGGDGPRRAGEDTVYNNGNVIRINSDKNNSQDPDSGAKNVNSNAITKLGNDGESIVKNGAVTNSGSNRNSGLRTGLLRDTSVRLAPYKEPSSNGSSSHARGTGQEKVIAVTAGRGENVHIIDTGQVPGRAQARRRGGGAPTWKN